MIARYAKGIVAGAGLVTSPTLLASLPAPYNLWGAVAASVLSLIATVAVPNATVKDVENDVRVIVQAVKAAEAATTPTIAFPTPPATSPNLDAALAILTPPAS